MIPAVDAAEFLGLVPTTDPLRWQLPVVDSLTTARNQLFGGVGLGAAVAALELATGRPLICGSAQYIGYAEPPSVLDLELEIAAAGKLTTQARAVARVEGAEIFTVAATLGSRPLELRGTWVERPDVPPAEAFPPTVVPEELRTRVTSRMELRIAGDDRLTSVAGHGRLAVWARVPGLRPCTALLAMLGDVVAVGVRRVMDMRGSGHSLDNTLRVARIVPTDWVLLDIRIHSVEHGFGHGAVHLWAEDGTLLGTAAQSVIVRPPDETEAAD